MSESVLAAALSVAIAFICGVLVPWGAIRMMMKAHTPRSEVVNYRGLAVAPVLGVVWPIWAVSLLVGQTILEAVGTLGLDIPPGAAVWERIGSTPLALPLFGVPFLLVTGAYAFGMADDAFGDSSHKGFRGHLRALGAGRLTTGLLKMAGIGGIALVYGASAASGVLQRSGVEGDPVLHAGLFAAAWLLAALTIALAANLLNLLDLRPGRALKSYVVLVAAPAALFSASAVASYNEQVVAYAGELSGLALGPGETFAVTAGMLLIVLGPALAVWRYDLGERGMLGDGGANAAGAVVGYLLAGVLSLTGLAVATGVLLVLNVASERVSFSAIIERVGFLRWLDGLGRGVLPDEMSLPSGGESGDGAAQAPPVRYDANGTASEGED